MTNQVRTPEEIEELKKSWKHDPIWDIENTDGFQAHNDELLAWREEYEAEQKAKWLEAENERIEKVMLATGVGKAYRGELLALRTFKEIESETHRIENVCDDPKVAMTAMLVRATLLQAAQLKRIADALESMADGDSLSNSVKIWGS